MATIQETLRQLQIMRVSKDSDPNLLGAAIAHAIENDGYALLSSIGAASINQAVKAFSSATYIRCTNYPGSVLLKQSFMSEETIELCSGTRGVRTLIYTFIFALPSKAIPRPEDFLPPTR